MVCVYCGESTKVVNSRLRRKYNQVWRRRQCVGCRAVFTTEETVDYGTTWTVKDKTGSYVPFLPPKLLLSLHRSLEHRRTALDDAEALSRTIIRRLGTQNADGRIDRHLIADTAQVALNRFDKAASTHYAAHHRKT